MQNAKDKLRKAWDDNPLAVIGVAAIAATALGKLFDGIANINRSRTWRREVDRRAMKQGYRR